MFDEASEHRGDAQSIPCFVCRRRIQTGYLFPTSNLVEHSAGGALLADMAGSVLGIVKEHLDCFPDTDADALFSAIQLLKHAKSCFDIEMRQELLWVAKVSLSVCKQCKRIIRKVGL